MLTALEHDGVNHQTRRGLNNAIQAYVFGNDQLAHSVHQVRPRKGYASAITTTKQLHSLTDSRARLCEIDKVIFCGAVRPCGDWLDGKIDGLATHFCFY